MPNIRGNGPGTLVSSRPSIYFASFAYFVRKYAVFIKHRQMSLGHQYQWYTTSLTRAEQQPRLGERQPIAAPEVRRVFGASDSTG